MRSCSPFLTCLLLVGVSCQGERPEGERNGGAHAVSPKIDPFGEWNISFGAGDRKSAAILSLLRDSDGRPSGQWIDGWGMSDLSHVTVEDGVLRFRCSGRIRDDQSTSWRFRGTIEKDVLSGTLSSELGEFAIRGRRIPELPDLVGVYAMGYATGRVNSKLRVRIDGKGELSAEWQADSGNTPLSDFAVKKRSVTFTYNGMAYEGGLRNDNLDGTFDTDRGKIPVAAMRMGAAIIGSWDLDFSPEDGTRKQQLVIHPDLSGRYGPLPIEISVGPPTTPLKGFSTALLPLDNRPLTFRATATRGGREIEIRFSGKVIDSKLTGDITSPGGSAKVLGKRRPAALR